MGKFLFSYLPREAKPNVAPREGTDRRVIEEPLDSNQPPRDVAALHPDAPLTRSRERRK